MAAILSAPVNTASMAPEARRPAAAESGSTVTGMPALDSSHDVSLDPCSSGLVSSAKAIESNPRSQAS